MNIKKEQEEQIINCGVFGYDSKKIANILGFDNQEVQREMTDETSEFYTLLQKGKDIADYVIDLKLFEMAKGGDIGALDKFEYRKRDRKDFSELL